MIIANPIYDVVFKRLMENERIAKFFIGTLLNQIIESVEMRPPRIYLYERTGRPGCLSVRFCSSHSHYGRRAEKNID